MKKRTRVVPFDGKHSFHPVLPNLGPQLRQIRKGGQYTTISLAKALGYSQSYISGVETGHAMPCLPFLLA